jgi:hypothetical protein
MAHNFPKGKEKKGKTKIQRKIQVKGYEQPVEAYEEVSASA